MLPMDVWINQNTSSSTDDVQTLFFAPVDHTALRIIYFIIGAIGIIDNVFVIVVFAMFVHIADKVWALHNYNC